MIKEFFEKKIVKIIEGVVIAAASAGLITGGVEVETLAKIPTLIMGIITAIEAIVTLIQGFTTKKEIDEE